MNAELIGDTETHKVQIGGDVKLVDGDISFVDERQHISPYVVLPRKLSLLIPAL